MSCNIQRNSIGQIVKIVDNNSVESRLFKTLASHPFVSSTEQALGIYKNKFIKQLKDIDESTMELNHKVGDENFGSLKNALKSARENTEISIGILTNGKFTELLAIPKNTDLTNEIGFIQSNILNDNIAEERIKVGNEYKLQAFGKSQARKLASLSILREQSSINLGSQSMSVDNTAFTLKKTLGITSLYTKNGEKVEIENGELSKMSNEEIISKFDSELELIAERELTKNFPLKRNSQLPTNTPIIKEDSELVRNLMSLLKKMGISVVSMANYNTNYTLRHGVNPNAEAVADVANQVIGILTGKETVENLLEETVHFIVEAFPQEKIENVLRNLPKSEEYKQHYQIQKAIYESEYSGEELENVVNREILGKIILNALTQTEAKSEMQQNFFENAKRFISEFFQDIVNYLKPEYQVELDNLLEDVRNLIDTQNVSELELGNFEGNSSRFYNVVLQKDDELTKEALKNIAILTKLEKDLNKTGKGNALNLKELKKAQADLEKGYNEYAIAKVTSITNNTVKLLETALKDSKDNNKSYDLSQEENVIYSNLISDVRKGLSVLKEMLDNKVAATQTEKTLANNIGQTVSKIGELEAKRTVDHLQLMEKMIRTVTTDRGLSEKEFETMMAWTLRTEKDINWVNLTFGTLNSSSDALANIYAKNKTDMTNEGSQKSHNETKALQGELKKYGYDEKYVASLVKNGFFESERDLFKYLQARDQNFLDAFNAEIPANKLTLEELLKARKEDKLIWTPEQQEKIEKVEKKANEKISERRMLDSYYTELEAKYTKLDISEQTQELLGALNSQKSKIRSKIVDANGVEDLSKLSLQDIELLKQLDARRKQMKSPVEFDGKIKEGLIFNDKEIAIKTGFTVDTLNSDSRIAYDIFRLDNDGNILREARLEELKLIDNKTTAEEKELKVLTEFIRPTKFDNLILSKVSKEEQVKALLLNANIGFTNEFWQNSKSNQSLIDRLNSVKNTTNEGDIEILIARLQDINDREKALIKAHTKSNNPSETDVESMSLLTKTALKELAEDAEKAKDEARKLTKDVKIEVNENQDGVSGVNEAWNDLLLDNGLEINSSNTLSAGTAEDQVNLAVSTALKVVGLAKQNATTKNAQIISDMESGTRLFRAGKTTHVSKSVQNALDKQGFVKADLNDNFKYSQFIKTYSEDRLLGYYKRYTPASYTEFQEDLIGDLSMVDILKKDYQYLQITPNYSFNDEDTSKINPDYIRDSKMGFTQPKKSLFENKEITNKFGKITRDDKGYIVSAERGENEFQAYKAVMNFRFRQVDTMDGGANYNSYITPQIRKESIERLLGGIKNLSVQGIKDSFENLLTYTEDDQIQGDNTFGVNNKIIPRQYLNTLENQTDITSDVFNALIVTNNAANLYESRVNHYSDFMAIRDVAKNRQTIGANKETSATNRFKTIDSAIDNDIFGIKQISTDTVGGVDIGKAVDSLGAFIRFKGLGFSAIIPATAYLTGKTKQTVERVIGQYYNKDSYNRGTKEFNKQLGKALSETGQLRSVAEMNTKGEYWQAFELENRLYGSNFNMLQRFSSKSAMLLYQAANYSIYAKNMYNVLHDFRVVDGKVVKFTDFERNERNKDYNRTKEQIKVDWVGQNDVINNFHTSNDNGEIIWDKVGLKNLLTNSNGQQYTDESLNQEINRFTNDIRTQIKNLNVRSDMALSKEDKTLAHRHYLTSFLLNFKGFLLPLFSERFKHTGYNSDSRQLEGGSYSGIFQLGKDIVNDWRKNGGSFIDAFQKQYNGDFTEQKARIDNLKTNNNRTETENEELKTLSENLVRDMEMVDLHHNQMKRLAVDLLVLQGLVAIMMLLRGFADDDKNKSNYALQMASLLSQRLAGEVNSSNMNITSNYYDIVASPLSGFKMITDLSKLPKAYRDENLTETIAKGYLPFVNSFQQMQDPSKASNSMEYYNEVKADAFVLSPIYHLMLKN